MSQDWGRVLGDFREAAATGREPEDVQAERHARECQAVERSLAESRRGGGRSALRMKRWFNRRWPYLRRCMQRWCLRGQVYDHRCHRHQDFSFASRRCRYDDR